MAKKPMTAAQYEKTAMDKRADKAGAKKAGVSVATWERGKADAKADKAAMKKINGKRGC
jgi:hypothetical protein